MRRFVAGLLIGPYERESLLEAQMGFRPRPLLQRSSSTGAADSPPPDRPTSQPSEAFRPPALKDAFAEGGVDGGTLWTEEEVALADSLGFAWLAAEPGPGVAVGDALPADVKVVFLDNFNAVMLRSGSWVRCELVSKSTASSWIAQRTDYLRAAAGLPTAGRPASTAKGWSLLVGPDLGEGEGMATVKRYLEASAAGSSDDHKRVKAERLTACEVPAVSSGPELRM